MTTDYTATDRKNPRILMTVDTVGGVWTYALELARALIPHGVEIALATMGRKLDCGQRAEVGALPNVEVFESDYKLEWMPDPWADVAAAGDWLLELEQRLSPSLIHLNGYTHAALPWRAPKLVVGHSCVLSWWRAVHGTDAPGDWAVYRKNVIAGMRAADLVVAPSHAMLEALQRHYGPLPASRVIPNGRELRGLKPEPKEKIILAAGRLWDAAKNVAALATIAPDLPWTVCLAGEERAPGDGVAELALLPVRHLGRLSADELLPWFARASIYALPARYEPFGLSALEAALAGCALVLGDIPSLREIWGDSAWFVPPNEPGALKAALEELIASPARLAELADKAREHAACFTPARMAANYLAAYRECGARSAERGEPVGQGVVVGSEARSAVCQTERVACSASRPPHGQKQRESFGLWVSDSGFPTEFEFRLPEFQQRRRRGFFDRGSFLCAS